MLVFEEKGKPEYSARTRTNNKISPRIFSVFALCYILALKKHHFVKWHVAGEAGRKYSVIIYCVVTELGESGESTRKW